MNRNVESHFSKLPSADIQRSVFDRSSDHKTSFNVGDLIPFYIDEVLPGDTFDVTTSKVVRSQTLLTPIMDNIYLDCYYFSFPTGWSGNIGKSSVVKILLVHGLPQSSILFRLLLLLPVVLLLVLWPTISAFLLVSSGQLLLTVSLCVAFPCLRSDRHEFFRDET